MILCVEPHADDIFLSLGGLVERWVAEGEEVTIMTVYSGTRKRGVDAENYAKAVGAKWVGLGFIEVGDMKPGGAAGALDDTYIKNALQINGDIILPLGVGGHPEHIYVRKTFEKFLSPHRVQYYVDMPYATKQKHQNSLQLLTSEKEIVALMRPGAKKYRHIPLFKDQSRFFYFEGEEALLEKTFELVVK